MRDADKTKGQLINELAAMRQRVTELEALETQRKEIGRALRESEERYRLVVENANAAMEVSQDGMIKFFNPKTIEITGYSHEELTSKPFAELIHPDDRHMVLERHTRRLKGEEFPHIYPFRMVDRAGNVKWVEINAVLVTWEGRPATLNFLNDITERKHMEEMLERSEKYFRSLIENSLDAIAIMDGDITMRYFSPSFENMLGYKPEDHVGKNPLELVHPDDMARVAETFTALIQTPGSVGHMELRGKHKDESWRTFEIVGKNLLDDPVVGGIVVNFRDITERKAFEDKLQVLYQQERDLRKQLEEEIKKRVEFTRALTHELKTPLTSILASSDLLLARLREGPLLSLAKNIGRSASDLNGRIDELLDLARGEVGMLQLKLEPVDLLQLVREIAENMGPVALKHGQSLSLDLAQSLPVIQADATRVQQVVFNLLDNAIKFTPKGGRITLRAKIKDSGLSVEVQDTGPGIPKEEQQRLFEPYHRLNSDRGRLSGLGLGLALSKTIVELHKGKIWVKSQIGRGSTFGFTLPLQAIAKKAKKLDKVRKLWKVLMIEDDPGIIEFISLAFQMEWPEAELVSTGQGEEGIDLVETEAPDIVILDLGLPDISGFEVLRQIRLFSPVPIVILTVKTEEPDIVKGLEWGADDYVTKPFRQKELLARLKVQLRKEALSDGDAPTVCGLLRFDPSTSQLNYGGNEINLTVVEGHIIQFLMRNAGHVVTHSRLAEAVWGDDYPGATETLRVYVRRLREKLEQNPSNPKLLITKSGIGYSLVKPV